MGYCRSWFHYHQQFLRNIGSLALLIPRFLSPFWLCPTLHVHTHIFTCLHTHIYPHTNTYMPMCTQYMNVPACVCAHAHTHIHTLWSTPVSLQACMSFHFLPMGNEGNLAGNLIEHSMEIKKRMEMKKISSSFCKLCIMWCWQWWWWCVRGAERKQTDTVREKEEKATCSELECVRGVVCFLFISEMSSKWGQFPAIYLT